MGNDRSTTYPGMGYSLLFWWAFCRESHITIHGRLLAVDNSHHGAEALFKGIGRAMKQALASEEELQSTKGVLT
jgi:imidazoleglycerol-phosphate dehydratase